MPEGLGDIGIASGTISMSDLRTWYARTGSVDLNNDFNGTRAWTESSLPGAVQPISLSDFYSAKRNVEKVGDTQRIASGSYYDFPTTGDEANAVEIKVTVVGGGGSGGGCSTDSGREKVASGGGGAGTATRRYTKTDLDLFPDGVGGQANTTFGATISIAAGASGISYSASSGYYITGRTGGNTQFVPFNAASTTITGNGGGRGYASRLGSASGDASTSPVSYGWGRCDGASGGIGINGENNSTGAGSTGFNIGGDQSSASGGSTPSVNGEASYVGNTISGSGYRSGTMSTTAVLPAEWDNAGNSRYASIAQGGFGTWQGGYGVQHSSGAAGASSGGSGYGTGSGGSASESGAGSTGSGRPGVIAVLYYGVAT